MENSRKMFQSEVFLEFEFRNPPKAEKAKSANLKSNYFNFEEDY
jgi:hypothetical protein